MTKAMTQDIADTKAAHLEAFDTLAPTLPGAALGWLDALRQDSLERFRATGLPHRGFEAWKFTTLDALTRAPFAPRTEGDEAPVTAPPLPDEDYAARLVFVGSWLEPSLSVIPAPRDGIVVTTLERALEEDAGLIEGRISSARGGAESLWDLNAAFMAGGAVVRLAEGAVEERPIELVFIASGPEHAARHLRNLIILDKGARARVIETYIDAAGESVPTFTNAVTDVGLAEGARLTHGRIQAQAPETIHTSRTVIGIGPSANYASFALATGGALSRQESDVAFTAPKGRARLFGAYLGRDRQHLDHTTRVDHAHPDCTTEELFKGVLDDRAHGVFQGLIRVAPHAIGTDAMQKNHALLLSRRAVADTKPELEILADDVKCAHGASVGDLDADSIFYLMSRGLSEAEARRLLVGGFIGDLIEGFGDEPVARYLRAAVARWQQAQGGDDHV